MIRRKAMTSRRCSAFTLIELLTVVAIISILAALTFGLSKYATTRTLESRIRAEIKALDVALEAYKLDVGVYPSATSIPRTDLIQARTNSKLLFQALSGNGAGTDLNPDSTNKTYFLAFKTGKNGNIAKDTVDGKYYIVDAISNPYNYLSGTANNQTNKVSYDLWSFGLDSTCDTADDIANWKY